MTEDKQCSTHIDYQTLILWGVPISEMPQYCWLRTSEFLLLLLVEQTLKMTVRLCAVLDMLIPCSVTHYDIMRIVFYITVTVYVHFG